MPRTVFRVKGVVGDTGKNVRDFDVCVHDAEYLD